MNQDKPRLKTNSTTAPKPKKIMIQQIKSKLKYEKEKWLHPKEEKEIRAILREEHRPIYHVHIRKTAGTTINFAFLSNAHPEDVEEFYEDMGEKDNHRIIQNNKIFVGWNPLLINKGRYSYAFSHTPLHQLQLAKNIFRFTCLRDPAKRVVSHYNMLRYFQLNGINHACMKTEGKWLGDSFADFMTLAPKEHLLNQLYMFSKEFNVDEVIETLLSLDKIIHTENLANGLKDLEELTGWELPVSNQKSYGFKEEIDESQIKKLKEILAPEYLMLEKLQKEI